ncbi:MAG: cupin domain-containing protein [Acidobacteriota bacterium]|jgi:mannose-6-phosphate isomerase-like protein (cupin superfamily)
MGGAVRVVALAETLARFDDAWSPRIVGELNGQHLKVAKFRGPFTWHRHADEDEAFLVLRGSFRLELRDGTLDVGEGELAIVPRGVEHRPVADEEAHVLLFEPASTRNTGDVTGPRTVERPEWV